MRPLLSLLIKYIIIIIIKIWEGTKTVMMHDLLPLGAMLLRTLACSFTARLRERFSKKETDEKCLRNQQYKIY